MSHHEAIIRIILGGAVMLYLLAGIVGTLAKAIVLDLTINRQARRIINGQCWNCGYDVRYSDGRCPECWAKR